MHITKEMSMCFVVSQISMRLGWMTSRGARGCAARGKGPSGYFKVGRGWVQMRHGGAGARRPSFASASPRWMARTMPRSNRFWHGTLLGARPCMGDRSGPMHNGGVNRKPARRTIRSWISARSRRGAEKKSLVKAHALMGSFG